MTEAKKFYLILAAALLAFAVIVGSVMYESAKKREVFLECVKLSKEVVDKGGRDSLYCRL